jgi:hypothetical protein
MNSEFTDEDLINSKDNNNDNEYSMNDTMKNVTDDFESHNLESNPNGEIHFNYDIEDSTAASGGGERAISATGVEEEEEANKEEVSQQEDDDDDDEDSDDENGTVNVVIDLVNKSNNAAALNRQKSLTKPLAPSGTGGTVPINTQISTTSLGGGTGIGTNVTGVSTLNALKPLAPQQVLKGVDVEAPGTINDLPTFDYDLADVKDEDKPWRKPGADITDYFNYGFSEESWILYCMKQKRLRAENSNFKVLSIKLFFL